MNTHLDDRDELFDLAADYVHGTITAAEGSRLEAFLQASPGARRDFVDYCMLHGQMALSTTAVGPGDRARSQELSTGSSLPGIGRVAVIASGLALAGCLALVLLRTARDAEGLFGAGSYDNRQLPLVTVASLNADGESPTLISASTLRPDKATALRSKSGADVSVAQAAVFGVTAGDSGVLYEGSVQARLAAADANFSVTAANLRIVTKARRFASIGSTTTTWQ